MRLKLFAAIASMVTWSAIMPDEAQAVRLVDETDF
jgi:hypothetical protein